MSLGPQKSQKSLHAIQEEAKQAYLVVGEVVKKGSRLKLQITGPTYRFKPVLTKTSK